MCRRGPDADRDGPQRYPAFGLTSSIAGKGWPINAAHLMALRAVAIAQNVTYICPERENPPCPKTKQKSGRACIA